MIYFLAIFGMFLLIFGTIGAFAATIVMAVMKKKKIWIAAICIPLCLIVSLTMIMISGYMYGKTDKYKESMAQREIEEQKESEETSRRESQKEQNSKENKYTDGNNNKKDLVEQETKAEKDLITEEETENQKNFDDLAEEEYKEQCKEMFYDDIFFSDESFAGEYVKLHLFLSEKYFFTADAMYNDAIKTLHDENNLYKDYYKSCVLREGTNSYVGQQIYVFFSKDYEINPEDYKTGQKIMMYGKVIHCVTNTWDGYNQVCFMPKYTEEE